MSSPELTPAKRVASGEGDAPKRTRARVSPPLAAAENEAASAPAENEAAAKAAARDAEKKPQPASKPASQPISAPAAAAAATLRATPPPRPRLWVPPDEAASLAAAAAAAVPQPPPEARTAVCDICGDAGAWASNVGTGAEARQPVCAKCRVWRRFPRVGPDANLTPAQLPSSVK